MKSVRAKMVTRTTAFSLQFHFVKLILYLTWAPPPQIYSQETGWYGQVEMENGRAKCLDRLVPSTLQNSRWRDAAETVRKWILSHTTGFSLQVHFLELRFHLPEAPPYQIYSQEIGWYCHFDRQNWQVNFSDRLFASMPAEQSFRRGSEICSSKNGDSHYCILSSISFR